MTPYQGRFTAGSKTSHKEYDYSNDKMTEYLAEVRRMENVFNGFEVRFVPRLDNRDADNLVWIASSRTPTLLDIIIEKLFKPSVKSAESTNEVDLMVIDEPNQEPAYDWMHPIKMFLENHLPSDDNAEVECISHRSKQYHLIDAVLFQRCVNGMMMKCISREE
jgi:hypothetical protein